MKCFKYGGMAFYMLEAGENYPDATADKEYIGAYVVFPFKGHWLAQILTQGNWTDITDQRFDSENAAFNFAYQHHTAAEEKLQRGLMR